MYIFLIESEGQTWEFLPGYYTALVNSRFGLSCILDNWDRIMEWVWYFRGGPLPQNAIKEFIRSALTKLNIPDVQQSNAGTYTCTAYKGDEEVYSRSMYLAVVGE